MSIAEEVRRFGEEVRQRREALGLSLEEMAERMHMSPLYLGEVERGTRKRGPSLDFALKIARGFGVELGDLLGGFKGLSARGIEAGRLFERLPSPLQQPTLHMLRAMAPHCAPPCR
ncbi:MAG: helix-turn-helix transcriptional regulator [Polyangiaceae bacterium]|nr:helix-turn-helix transcriptional regulator [Polyangiaceae bacterium]